MNINKYFSDSEKLQIINAIKEAEHNTSGEIRVHIESKCKGTPLDSAAFWFKKLQMHETDKRNGVLFYLAVSDNMFAILGDVGINQKVEENFWDDVKEQMLINLKNQEVVLALTKGIEMAGEKLKAFFPYQSDDVNELSDDISFGK